MIPLLSAVGIVLSIGVPLFEIYLLAFGTAALICFGSLRRARQIENIDTRHGLVALLAISGVWAALHVGYLIAPTTGLQYGFYMAGLIVGLSTVGPWLYFCSAYTGRALHHNKTYQWTAVGVYLGIVAIKLTNPYHGLYFTATEATVPFAHLMITHQPLHWVAMALSYSLAIVGIFMLFELFAQVDYDTTPFVVLVGLTALPVVLDIVGFVSPLFVDITYSALGVAVFAVGVLFVYIDRFESIQLAGQYDDPVIVLDEDNQIRDFNSSAVGLFPGLATNTGVELSEILPAVAVGETTDEIITQRQNGKLRYFRVSTNPFSASHARLGQLIVFTDVTNQEQYRQELERQNNRLEAFAGMVSHDLRNPLNVAQGNIDIAREALSSGSNEQLSNSLETVDRTLTRMETLIGDLLVLARQGQPIDDTDRVSLAHVVTDCWEMVDSVDAQLVVDDDLTFEADPERLQQLFENLFRNSIEHGGQTVTIHVGALETPAGFYIEDTGSGIPQDKQADVFESGFTTTRNGTGFGLAIVKEIVDAHGWTISVSNGETGGARFEITHVTTHVEQRPTDEPTKIDRTA